MQEDDVFVQVSVPDRMKLAELLLEAKGGTRTMAKFAELINTSPATLSRIVTGNIKRPLSYEFLRKLFEQKDEHAKFSFDVLLAANGMVARSTYERGERMALKRERMALKEEKHRLKRQAENAMVRALAKRGVNPLHIYYDLDPRRNYAPYGFEIPSDFDFYVEDAPQRYWYFLVVDRPEGVSLFHGRAFTRTAKIFLVDAWDKVEMAQLDGTPSFFASQKTSFVFFNQSDFELFVRTYQYVTLYSAVSAILVDAETEEFVKETAMSEAAEHGSVLERPIVEDESDEGSVCYWLDDDCDD
jgi:transcriptional regulator with XRE-family HTH domain